MVWPGIEHVPISHVNVGLSTLVPAPTRVPEGTGTVDEVVLSLGYVTPPVILGSPEEQATLAQALSAVAVQNISRFSMTRAAFLGLVSVLQESVDNIHRAEGDPS